MSETAAIVTIFKAGKMTPAGRKRIASWLRKQAGFLEKHSKELSSRYCARYIYAKEK